MSHIACRHCDLLIKTITLSTGESAVCPRCHQTIYLDQQAFHTSIALLITALLLYVPAMFLPFLSMETIGQTQQVSLFTSITVIAQGKMLLLALTVLALVMVFPLIRMLGLLLVMLPLSQQRLPWLSLSLTKFLLALSPWNMVEVYLVGVLVSLVKLAGMATVTFSNGFFAFVLLIIVNTLITINLPSIRIWQKIAEIQATDLSQPLKRGSAQ